MAELAARHAAVERVAVELEPGEHALDDRTSPGPCDSPAVVKRMPIAQLGYRRTLAEGIGAKLPSPRLLVG